MVIFDGLDLRSGNILFDVHGHNSHAMVDLQPQTAEGSLTTEDGHVLLPSKPFALTDKLPVQVKITDFGVGVSFPFLEVDE